MRVSLGQMHTVIRINQISIIQAGTMIVIHCAGGGHDAFAALCRIRSNVYVWPLFWTQLHVNSNLGKQSSLVEVPNFGLKRCCII